MYPRHFRAAALAACLSLAAGCGDAAETHLTAPEAPRLSTTYGATILECPVATGRTRSALIGPQGGVLELDGHRVVVPLGAVLGPRTFTIAVPASNYLEVELSVAGQAHAEFRRPVAVTLSYDRCTRGNVRKEDLRIYHVDRATKSILAEMGGVNDAQARTVTTSTGHFSGYAIGVNRSGDEGDGGEGEG